MRKIIISALVLLFGLDSMAQDAVFDNKTVQIASYKIDAKLDTDAKMISATEVLRWKNNTSDTVRS